MPLTVGELVRGITVSVGLLVFCVPVYVLRVDGAAGLRAGRVRWYGWWGEPLLPHAGACG